MRVYRVMKAYRMLLEHHAAAERGRDGRVAVDRPDSRSCSYIFEIGCDNGSPPTLRARRVRSPRDRPLAADHASRKPTIERHGRNARGTRRRAHGSILSRRGIGLSISVIMLDLATLCSPLSTSSSISAVEFSHASEVSPAT